MAKSSTSGQGRPKGATNKATRELKELLAAYDGPIHEELVRLCLHAENEATRVSAIKEFYDRRIGKPHQTAEIVVTDRMAYELTDDELAGIIAGRRSTRTPAAQNDPQKLH